MPKPDDAWMPCLRCTRGKNGDKDCSAGWNARSLKQGCFCGIRIPKS